MSEDRMEWRTTTITASQCHYFPAHVYRQPSIPPWVAFLRRLAGPGRLKQPVESPALRLSVRIRLGSQPGQLCTSRARRLQPRPSLW